MFGGEKTPPTPGRTAHSCSHNSSSSRPNCAASLNSWCSVRPLRADAPLASMIIRTALSLSGGLVPLLAVTGKCTVDDKKEFKVHRVRPIVLPAIGVVLQLQLLPW